MRRNCTFKVPACHMIYHNSKKSSCVKKSWDLSLGFPSTGLCSSGKCSVTGTVTCKDHLVKSRAIRERKGSETEVKKIVAASIPLNCFMQSSPSQGNTFRRKDGAVHWILLKKISVLIIKAVLSYRTSIGNCLILCFFFGDWGPRYKIYMCSSISWECLFSVFVRGGRALGERKYYFNILVRLFRYPFPQNWAKHVIRRNLSCLNPHRKIHK